MLLQLQKGAVYGPVRSRRLGVSLGVNVLPSSVKVCTFNCLYCQYGFVKECPLRIGAYDRWPSVAGILDELEHALWEILEQPAYITLSGNGEPTLHPRFDELVDGITTLRNRYAPRARTAILSNATTVVAGGFQPASAGGNGSGASSCNAGVDHRRVRDALMKLDVRIMKFECGTDAVLRRYNRPCGGMGTKDIAAGLVQLDDLCIQALFAGGEGGNADPGEVAAWIEDVASIRPRHVQIYTLDRGYASPRIAPLSAARMRSIADRVRAAGFDAEVYTGSTVVAGREDI